MPDWNDPWHVAWSVVGFAVLLAAVAALLSSRSRHVRRGWKSKVVWMLALGVGGSINGFWIPVGPIAVLVALRRELLVAPLEG